MMDERMDLPNYKAVYAEAQNELDAHSDGFERVKKMLLDELAHGAKSEMCFDAVVGLFRGFAVGFAVRAETEAENIRTASAGSCVRDLWEDLCKELEAYARQTRETSENAVESFKRFEELRTALEGVLAKRRSVETQEALADLKKEIQEAKEELKRQKAFEALFTEEDAAENGELTAFRSDISILESEIKKIEGPEIEKYVEECNKTEMDLFRKRVNNASEDYKMKRFFDDDVDRIEEEFGRIRRPEGPCKRSENVYKIVGKRFEPAKLPEEGVAVIPLSAVEEGLFTAKEIKKSGLVSEDTAAVVLIDDGHAVQLGKKFFEKLSGFGEELYCSERVREAFEAL